MFPTYLMPIISHLTRIIVFAGFLATGFAQGQNPMQSVGAAGAFVAPKTASAPLDNNTPLFNAVEQAAPGSALTTEDGVDFFEVAKPAQRPERVAITNQFQRFVEESTGKSLPVFGSNLFVNPDVYAANSAIPAPLDYVLGVGDQVQVQVWGPIDFSGSLIVDRNGQVNIPKVGVVTLAGVTVRDLESVLRAHLSKVFVNFNLSASLGRLRGIQVYVVGQAVQPGTLQVSSLSTLVNALFASGGPNANGSMRNIELKRGGKTVTTFDVYDFIARGDKSRDAALMAGDVIVIPPVGARVAVTGAFDQAAIYELKNASTTVSDILALSGGVPALAATKKAQLERISREGDSPRQVQEVVLDAQGMKQVMRDGDVLTLLDIRPAFANAVTLQGTVAEPLRHRWFEGMKILDLIPDRAALVTHNYYKRKNLLVQNDTAAQSASASSQAGATLDARIRNMVDQINWDYAVIERMDSTRLNTQLIPFNLGKAVLQRDPAHNLALLPGDVVTILSQKDLRLPQERQSRLVRIEGEVAAAGVYQALPGETLPQLIKRIGGLSPQAYVFGIEFSRESVRKRQQENLDVLIKKLEAQSQSQAAAVTANRGAEAVAQAQVIQMQQQAQLKSQIDRLKAAQSSGRLALELDTSAASLAALPALPLEDGDRIVVPSVPGYVAALGSVNNDNVFIYKPGKTVADVLRSAGVMEDAEVAQIFVLRADGSIVSRRDKSGWFGGNFESLAIMPGDTVVVPAQIDRESRYTMVTRFVKDWTQIFSNFGLGVAAIKSIQ
jgi:protein involved in polysaccharide export with SLBB domain